MAKHDLSTSPSANRAAASANRTPRTRRSSKQDDCQNRLAKIAQVLGQPHWTEATHRIEDADGLFGPGTAVHFDAARLASPDDCAAFFHRTRHRAIERRLIKSTTAGWTVWCLSPRRRGKIERLDRKTWCGGYRVVASVAPTARPARAARPSGGAR
jgi:hypothetical protein